MDTSDTYIKMSEKSPLQELWIISEGDWTIDTVTFPGRRVLTIIVSEGGCPELSDDFERRHFKESQRRSFCLFRQDQLQEIYREGKETALAILSDFCYEILNMDGEHRSNYYRQFTSMEQLWLAFVMNQKYGKTWDGDDWVKKE